MVAGTTIHDCKWLQEQLCSTWNTRRRGQAGAASRPRTGGGAGGTTEARKPHRPPLPPAPAGRAGAACRPRAGEDAGGRPTEPREPHGEEPYSTGGGGLPPPLVLPPPARGRLAAPACPHILFNKRLVSVFCSVITYVNKVTFLVVY